MPTNSKLEQWRNKTEREKHTMAIIGATALTLAVVIVWGYTFFVALGDKPEMVVNEEYNEQFSPLAPFRKVFSDNLEKIKVGGGVIKNSASAIFGGASQ